MRKVRKEIQRQALYGWLWWAPIPLMVLGVLAVDTWLNIQTRRYDYEIISYKNEIARLEAALAEVRTELAGQQDLDQLSVYAEMLGLDDPAPNQIRLVPSHRDATYAGKNLVLARKELTARRPLSPEGPARVDMPVVPVAPVLAPPPVDAAAATEAPRSGKDLDASLEVLLEAI